MDCRSLEAFRCLAPLSLLMKRLFLLLLAFGLSVPSSGIVRGAPVATPSSPELLPPNEASAKALLQGLVLARAGERYAVWGDVDRQRLFEAEDAAMALQYALDRLAQADGALLLAVQSDRVVLADFVCVGPPGAGEASGIVMEGGGASVIRGVYAHRFPGCGIWLRGHSFANRIEGTFTSRNGRAGILVGQTSNGRGGRFVPNMLPGCISYSEDGHGFEFEGAICQNLVNCTAYLPRDCFEGAASMARCS